MSAIIHKSKPIPHSATSTFAERYDFDVLEVGDCLELVAGLHDDDVQKIVDNLYAFGQYRGRRFLRKKEGDSVFMWRVK